MALYSDYTSFEPSDDQWNGWVKGANGQALTLGEENGNHYAFFRPMGNLQGKILEKMFTRLVANEKYRVSIRVRRVNDQVKYPSISWRMDEIPLGDATPLYDREWHVIRTDFVAKDGPQMLALMGSDSAGSGTGADFWFDDIRIYPITLDENFDDSPGGIVKPGEALDQGALIISLPPTSKNNVGIRAHPLEETETQKGKGLAFNQNVPLDQPEQEVTLKLKGEYNKVAFSWSWISLPGTVTFYGPGKELLGQHSVDPSAGRHQDVSFKAGPDEYVTEIVVTARDFSYLDFFKFEPE
ncbi:hypothetical protein [Pseudomonas farsensis]|uniref:Uncharacterized protein n=1 Tax=Pseudomonas farsensis TaxID=2745492 RepID=A0ABU8QR37_9PSED